MTTTAAAVPLLLLLALGAASAASPRPWLCPPKRFDSVEGFDPAKFVAAPWFVQAQTPLPYQPPSDMFCVRASYLPIPAAQGGGYRVCNYANQGGVNKAPTGTCLAPGVAPPAGKGPSFEMTALPWPKTMSDPASAASKLLVGPTPFLAGKTPEQLAAPPMPGQKRAAGPYWVVAVGPSKVAALGYDWAIVTGGAPSVATASGGCLPPVEKGDGVWLFHRAPVAPAADLKAMEDAARALRLDLSALVKVTQAGCKYAGAV